MTTEQITRAVAKVDGWTWQEGTEPTYGGTNIPCGWIKKGHKLRQSLPDYTTSYDAILPACKKQSKAVQERIIARTTIFSSPLKIATILLEEIGN